MRYTSEQIVQQRVKALDARFIILNGDEPLLIEETLTALRADGFDERVSYVVDNRFQWDSVLQTQQAPSLFATRRLCEIRLLGTFGQTHFRYIENSLSDNANNQDVFLLISDKIKAPQRKTKWYKVLENQTCVIDVLDVAEAGFSDWLLQRIHSRDLQIDNDGLLLLQMHVEGNLLAAAQTVEQLRILAKDKVVTIALLKQCLADNSRYDVFQLSEACLAADTQRACKILHRLRGDAMELVIIVWALVKEIRLLLGLNQELALGKSKRELFAQHRVWAKKQPLMNNALARINTQNAKQLLSMACDTDQIIKGQKLAPYSDAWQSVLRLCMALCGHNNFENGEKHV